MYNAQDVHVFEDREVPNTAAPPHCCGVHRLTTKLGFLSHLSTKGRGKKWCYPPLLNESEMWQVFLFISLFNQLDAQNLFYNKFYFMPLHVSSTCDHHQEVKIALHSLWYHHSYRCDDTIIGVMIPDVEAWNKTSRETNFVHQVG